MKYDFDLIIPIYNGGGEDFIYRLRNMKILTSIIPYNVNLIIVEQVSKNKETYKENLHLLRSDTKYIVKNNSDIFNKSWLNNIGAKEALSNYIIFAESDCTFNPLHFSKFHDYVEENKKNSKWFYAWDHIEYLNKEMNKVVKSFTRPNATGVDGGFVCFEKDFYFEMGGSNEWLEGLGGIDNDLKIRAKYLSGSKKEFCMKGTIYHLWHPGSNMKGMQRKVNTAFEYNKYARNRQKNIRIVRQTEFHTGKITEFLQSHKNSIGGNIPLNKKIPVSQTVFSSIHMTNYERRRLALERENNLKHKKKKIKSLNTVD